MPFDALFLTAVRRELEGSLTGCRVDKVQQPQRDTLILSMRGAAGGGKLLLTASPNHPRIHLTNEPAENPAQPPMFCMLLRKHLTGGRLVGMQQPEMERLLDLTFDCTDEMGSPTQKHLILEIMGRNSNLILTAEDGRILDCLRRVDFEMSEQRQVLPGLYYHLPPTQGKRNPFAVTQEELTALLAAQRSPQRLDGWLLDTFGGFSPLVCRELAFCLTGDLDTDVSELPEAEKITLAARLHARIEQLRTQPPQPVLLERTDVRGTSPVCRSRSTATLSGRRRLTRSPACSTGFMPRATARTPSGSPRRSFARRSRTCRPGRRGSSRTSGRNWRRPMTASGCAASAIS